MPTRYSICRPRRVRRGGFRLRPGSPSERACGADPLVRGGPPGRPLARGRKLIPNEERVQGDPRGPGDPPHCISVEKPARGQDWPPHGFLDETEKENGVFFFLTLSRLFSAKLALKTKPVFSFLALTFARTWMCTAWDRRL